MRPIPALEPLLAAISRAGSGRAPGEAAGEATDAGPGSAPAASLAGLGVAGFGRRRAAFLAGTFVTVWIVAVFARQMSEASSATLTADSLRAENAALALEIDGLRAELLRIQELQYVVQQARAFDLGAARERAFVLAPDAPPLAPDAPGSAERRLTGVSADRSPLETWLSLLFGDRPR
ncbi:MAG: hypothetical protein RL338_797 [Chloroflexota bacterium]|jgi:hypothetical protein